MLLDAALRYANQGIAVFPVHSIDDEGRCTCGKAKCNDQGKHPVASLVPKGHLNATTDKKKIRAWWKTKAWNIGAVPGKGGYCVADVDPWKGEHEDLARLEKRNGPLPDTAVVASGAHEVNGETLRGRHYWMRLPEGQQVSKHTVEGIEVKGSGGYVLVPPSRHRSGVAYEFERGAIEQASEVPAWVLNGEQSSESLEGAPRSDGVSGLPVGQRTYDAIEHGLPEPTGGQTHRDVAVGLARNLREAGVPRRLVEHLMREAMLHEDAALRPEDPWTEKDVQRIVHSVFKGSAPNRLERRTPVSRFHLMSLAEAFVVAKEPVDWVIPDLLAAHEKAVIAGPPKSLKTWFALHLIRCVAAAEVVLEEEAWRVQTPQAVLIVEEEGAPQRWAQRLSMVFENAPDAPIYYTHRAGFALTDPAHVDWIIKQAQETDARLIVLDPWQRVTPGINEDKSSETGPAWDSVHRIASRTGAAVLLVHHSKKGAELSMDAIRGSSRMAGEVDLVLVVKKVEVGTLEIYLDGRDLVRSDDEGGNLGVAYRRDRPHVMRSEGFKVKAKGAKTHRTRDAVVLVLKRATEALKTSDVRVQVVEELGEERSRPAVEAQLQVLADQGEVEENPSGKGKATYWRWVDA